MGILDRLDRLADQLGDLIGPDDVRAHVELGAGYLERGDYDSALHELTRVTVLRPDHARAHYLLGLTHARRGEEPEAIAALTKAIAVRDDLAEARLALAELHRRRDELDEAVETYRAALERGLSDETLRAELSRGLGATYLRQGKLDKAVRELRKAAAGRSDDVEALALLGRALQLRGDFESARIALERAVDVVGQPEAQPLATLGEVYEKLARLDDAEKTFERAYQQATRKTASPTGELNDALVTALLGLARVRLAKGRFDDARTALIDARRQAPDRLDVELLEARVLAATVSPESALATFDRILHGHSDDGRSGFPPRPGKMLLDRRGVTREALALALRAGLFTRAQAYGESLLTDGAGPAEEPLAWAARALGALQQNDREAARLASRRALEADTTDAHLAAAEVAHADGHDAEAIFHLRRAAALSPDDPRPSRRVAQLRAVTVGLPGDLYGLIQRTHRLFVETRELGELAPEAARVSQVLDRPLLITVMGEFNAGKSTFVNALLGEEVAPMGIVPTTATINILKYGSERKGRVVYLDDTAREVDWKDVPKLLRGLDAAEAQRIRWVEVLYPLDVLQRVNVVDTPGLNSINAAHEEVARRFIAEADAVIWLFSVDQAAKATEGAALDTIASAGKKILGVLNKLDRVTPAELEQIRAHVTQAIGPRLETVVGVSAKEALAARKNGPQKVDEALLAKSNYAALHTALEERFFSRARALLKEVATHRLTALLDRARQIAAGAFDETAHQSMRQAEQATGADAQRFAERFLAGERLRLAEAAEQVSAASANEVLDFVRPRSWVFGAHQAQPADRDFLADLVEERVRGVLAASRARVLAEVAPAVERARALGMSFDSPAMERLLDQEVYGRYRAFVRGYLRGGWVDEFFARRLPNVELNLRDVQRALDRDAPWSDEWTSTELRAPLAAWSTQVFGGLVARLKEARSEADVARIDLEQRLLLPLERLRRALTDLSDKEPAE